MRADDELAAVPMLAALPHDHLLRLAADHPASRVPADSVLARRGEPARSLFVLQAGQVCGVVDHHDGGRTRYPVLTGPCVLDKAAAIRAETHTATWTTVSRCVVRTVPVQTFRRLLRDVPGLRDHVLGLLSDQVRDTRRALADRDAGSSVVKVARWLAVNAPAEHVTVALPTGQQGLAEELGLSRVTVNRALRQLAAAGVVDTSARGIHVLDAQRLARATER